MGERIAITAAAHRVAPAPAESDERAPLTAALRGFDASGFGAPRGAQIWMTPEEPEDDPALRILGPHGRLFDALAREVHETAGLAAFARVRVGLFAGMGMVDSPVGDLLAAAAAARAGDDIDWTTFYGGAYRSIHPLWPLSMLGNVAVGQVAIDLDIRGDNVVLASDADAGLRALLEAAASVRDGCCDAAVVGGVSGRIGPAALARLHLQERAEVSLGEGGAAFVFERETAARTRQRPALGYLLGGTTSFGASDAHPGPDASAVERAVRGAVAQAGIDPEDVSAVLLHQEGIPGARNAGSGEQAGIAAAGIPAGTLNCAAKLAYGHLGAGAPAYDVYAALELLGRRELLPEGSDLDLRYALVVACGAEGGAGALVLESAR